MHNRVGGSAVVTEQQMLTPPPPGFTKSIAENAAEHIRNWILTGELRPGSRLVIRDLAAQLGVSPMPVREALVALATEGLIVGQSHRGFRVVQLTKEDVKDAFAVYSYLAGMIAERVAEQASPELIDQITEIQERINVASKGTDPDTAHQVERLNHEFHRAINTSISADTLHWFLRMAARHIPRHFYVVPGWIELTVGDHPALIEAFASRDAAKARAMMAEHLDKTGSLLIHALDERGYWKPAE